MESGERRMLAVFLLVVAFWVFRPFLADFFGLPGLSDTAIALAGAVALFIIPSGKGGSLIDWLLAKQMPWDVLFLYGVGMALAAAKTCSYRPSKRQIGMLQMQNPTVAAHCGSQPNRDNPLHEQDQQTNKPIQKRFVVIDPAGWWVYLCLIFIAALLLLLE